MPAPPSPDDRSHALLLALRDTALILDAQGRILAANPAAVRQAREELRTPEELRGRPVQSLFPPELVADRLERLHHCLESGRPLEFEDETDTLAFEHSLQPVEPGNPEAGLVWICRDITRRRQLDIDLRREQQRQIFYLESLPGYVMLVDARHTIRYANRSFRQTFGPYRNRSCHDIVPDRPLFCPVCVSENCPDGTQPRQWEWTHPDGRSFQAFAHPMTDVDGSAVLLVLGIETTARKRAELALNQARDYQKAILDNIPDLVWLKDAGNRYVAVNQAYARACGRALEELDGEDERFAWGAEQGQHLFERDALAMRGRERVIEEEQLLDAQGQQRWLEAVRVPMADALGRSLGLVGIARDITQRKEAVDMLLYSHAEMERFVQERTTQLRDAVALLEREIEERKRTEEALQAAREKAEVAARAKSVFLANMSHEIRTPLNVVIAMADLALKGEGGTDQHRALEMVYEAGGTLLHIINDVLDYSKIEARKLDLELLDFDLHKTLEGIWRIHTLQAEKQGLRTEFRLDPATPRLVRGDPARLRQVLGNLLANAVKFTATGSVRLEVAPTALPPDGPPENLAVRFTVHDTGIGIPRDKWELIFESFKQADDETTRLFGGTGLGLSIAKRLVELMRGRLELDSTPGQGSTFTFTLPFQPGSEAGLRGAPASPELERPLPPLRILLAEDNALNRELLRDFLQARGHTPLEATNGREALALLARERVDLVLMDIQMPLLDGMAATSAIRASGGSLATPPTVPVLALTAHALRGDRERFLAAGLDGYVAKPLDLALLQREMARVLQGAPLKAPQTPAPPAVEAQAPPDSDSGGLNTRALALALLQGNESLLRRLDSHFLRDVPKDLAAMRQSLTSGDLGAVKELAHRLKSQAATVGAGRAAELAREMEGAAAAKDQAGVGTLLPELEAEARLVQERMLALPPLP